MLRKHFNSMSQQELVKAPFYSWQCLTLCLGHRDVDLVIPNEQDMKALLIFLIHKLRTINGKRDSAKKMLAALNNQAYREFKQLYPQATLTEQAKSKLVTKNEHKLFRKVYMKYIIMSVRAKISYHALLARKTIIELIT